MTGESAKPGEEAVVLASFANRRAAERMVTSLGRAFRKPARKGRATVLVISGNKDGSLKVTESRVVSAGDFTAVVSRLALSVTIGFMGIFSTLKGLLGGVRARRDGWSHRLGPLPYELGFAKLSGRPAHEDRPFERGEALLDRVEPVAGADNQVMQRRPRLRPHGGNVARLHAGPTNRTRIEPAAAPNARKAAC